MANKTFVHTCHWRLDKPRTLPVITEIRIRGTHTCAHCGIRYCDKCPRYLQYNGKADWHDRDGRFWCHECISVAVPYDQRGVPVVKQCSTCPDRFRVEDENMDDEKCGAYGCETCQTFQCSDVCFREHSARRRREHSPDDGQSSDEEDEEEEEDISDSDPQIRGKCVPCVQESDEEEYYSTFDPRTDKVQGRRWRVERREQVLRLSAELELIDLPMSDDEDEVISDFQGNKVNNLRHQINILQSNMIQLPPTVCRRCGRRVFSKRECTVCSVESCDMCDVSGSAFESNLGHVCGSCSFYFSRKLSFLKK